ncbi:DUF2238 domain-containing protein [Paenibacillus chitinolyticus]
MKSSRVPVRSYYALLGSLAAVFIWSGIRPHDYFTWLLEVTPGLILIAVLIGIYRRTPLTLLTYTLVWAHVILLFVGGHYTYAEVPLFNWLRDTFDLERNYYDRLGHFMQGFVPAILTREILIRKIPLQPGGWLVFLTLSVCLGFSAFYELLEFTVAKLTGTAAESFLGTQGDVWDTQWDMMYALIGAVLSLLLLGKSHNRAMRLPGSF